MMTPKQVRLLHQLVMESQHQDTETLDELRSMFSLITPLTDDEIIAAMKPQADVAVHVRKVRR